MALQAFPDWNWSAIVGSGFVVGVLFLALVERLRRTFATQREVDALRERCRKLEDQHLRAMRSARSALQRNVTLQAEQRHQWERIAEQVLRPLERAGERLDGLSEAQATQALMVEYLGRRLERLEVRAESVAGGIAPGASLRVRER